MGDAENVISSTRKRAAGRELSRDNPGLDDEEDVSEQDTGTFKKASDEVLATRRIVKVRRGQTTSAPSSNPFAGIRLVPPTETAGNPSEVKSDTQVVKEKTDVDDVNGKDVTHKESKIDGGVPEDETSEHKVDNTEAESVEKVENVAQKSSAIGESSTLEAIPKVDNSLIVDSSKTENKEPTRGDNIEDKELVRGDNIEDEECVRGDNAENEELVSGDKSENEELNGGNKVENKETDEQERESHGDKKEDVSEVESNKEASPLSSFQQLSSSQNAFTGLAGTGFSTSTFSFGNIPKDGVSLTAGFGLSNNGSSAIFGTSGSSIVSKSEGSGFPSKQEVSVETGEENDNVVFTADSILFEFIDGSWKERGKGELKVNVSSSGTGRGRLLMRARGNYRLILNASLYPDMKLTNMEKKGITFACINSTGEGKDNLSTFALKFKDGSIVEEFRAAVTDHKGKVSTVLKTPENSP